MTAYNYALNQTVTTIGGIALSEFADGDAVSFEPSGEGWAATVGSHGSVTRYQTNADNYGTATVRLLQGSQLNELLQSYYDLDRKTALGSFAFSSKDLLGTSLLTSDQAWIVGQAPFKFSVEAQGVEWKIVLANPKVALGKNNPV